MIRFLIGLVLCAVVSCKAQETKPSVAAKQDTTARAKQVPAKQDDPQSAVPKKPRFEDLYQDKTPLSPGTARVQVLVTGEMGSETLCNLPQKATLSVRIQKAMGTGSSIVNMLSAGQETTFAVSSFMKDKLSAKGTSIILLLRENICPDFGQTYYTIIGN